MGILSIKQSYLVMFHLLDKIWEKSKIDDLGGLLGSLNPYLFNNGESADPAAYEDWNNIIGKLHLSPPFSEREVLIITYEFLNQYVKDYGFNIDSVLEKIRDMLILDDIYLVRLCSSEVLNRN